MTNTTHYEPALAQREHEDYDQVLDDLSSASVHRSFDPYIDINWDSPELAVVPSDERWMLSDVVDPVGRHPWYQELPVAEKITVGMWRQANVVKTGLQFESILIRGLMQYNDRLPNKSKEFRYTSHEAKEECNHGLMFQELVNRIGVDVPGGPRWFRVLSPFIPLASTVVPTIFYIGVLAGEEPIDHVQKSFLRNRANLHPAYRAVMELHVAEEARHISFAHHLLEDTVPRFGKVRRFGISLAMPVVMRVLADVILIPPKQFREEFNVPKQVMDEIFWGSPDAQDTLANVFGDVRMLAERCGLMNIASRWLWRRMKVDGRSSRYRSEPTYTAAAA